MPTPLTDPSLTLVTRPREDSPALAPWLQRNNRSGEHIGAQGRFKGGPLKGSSQPSTLQVQW